MSSKKRERLEVIKDIVSVVRDKPGIGSTRMLYASNLSPQMHKEYLKELLDKDLLKEEEKKGKKTYIVTEKGFLFLERHAAFSHFVDEIGL